MNRLPLLLLLFASPAFASHLHPESWYIDRWCADHGGQAEVRMPDGSRADCVTERFAVELGFVESSWEDVPQARNYGKWTGKAPLVVIIVENPKRALPYLQRRLNTAHEDVTYEVWDVEEGQ